MTTAAVAIPFDTLAYAKKLETAGVPTAHAEAQAEALAAALQKMEEFRLAELATKRDIKELEAKLEAKLEASKADTIKWTAGMFAAQTALILGAMFAIMRMNQPPPPPVQVMTPPAITAPAPPAAR